jgi:3-dehydroquinate dehydratase I
MKICVPIIGKTTDEVVDKIKKAQDHGADLIEIWCGEITDLNFEKIFAIKKVPMVINCKGKNEKGSFGGTDDDKVKILSAGVKHGAEYCDLSYETPADNIRKIANGKCKIILSAHFWGNTPPLPSQLNIVSQMQKKGADIVKIASTAKYEKDLITTLRLAENLHRKNIPHIIISMGEIGSISRFIIPKLFGGEFTFAPIDKSEANAPGQIMIDELRELERIIGS